MSSEQPQFPPSNWEDRVVRTSPPPPRKVNISKFVKLEDHQEMAAACLDKQCKILQLQSQVATLAAEVERLRKANSELRQLRGEI